MSSSDDDVARILAYLKEGLTEFSSPTLPLKEKPKSVPPLADSHSKPKMASPSRNPYDIRSELAGSSKPPSATGVAAPSAPQNQPVSSPLSSPMQIASFVPPDACLAYQLPGDPGYPVDVDNTPDFEAIRETVQRASGPIKRVSKRQRGYSPTLGESGASRRPFKHIRPDYTLDSDPDDSDDPDFEVLVNDVPVVQVFDRMSQSKVGVTPPAASVEVSAPTPSADHGASSSPSPVDPALSSPDTDQIPDYGSDQTLGDYLNLLRQRGTKSTEHKSPSVVSPDDADLTEFAKEIDEALDSEATQSDVPEVPSQKADSTDSDNDTDSISEGASPSVATLVGSDTT